MPDNAKPCPRCDDRGWYWGHRRMRGWGATHNARVRNYSGGPRPNARTDYNETYIQRCDCEAGRSWDGDA